MLQVALDREVVVEVVVVGVLVLQIPPELAAHRLFGKVGDMREHPGDRQPFFRLFGVIAVIPLCIGHDGFAADPVEGNGLSSDLNGSGDRRHAADHFRIQDRPLTRQHAPHGAADHAKQFFDPEMVYKPFLRPDHIRDRDDRKTHPVRLAGVRIDRTRARGTGAAAQNVAADNEIFIGIERTAGSDLGIPPAGFAVRFRMEPRQMRIAGQSMFHQNRIGLVGIERAVGLITDIDAAQRPAAIELQRILGRVAEAEIPALDDPD